MLAKQKRFLKRQINMWKKLRNRFRSMQRRFKRLKKIWLKGMLGELLSVTQKEGTQ